MRGDAVISACERLPPESRSPLKTCPFLVKVVAHGTGDEDVRCGGCTQAETGNPLRTPSTSSFGIRRGQCTYGEAPELGEPAEDESAKWSIPYHSDR